MATVVELSRTWSVNSVVESTVSNLFSVSRVDESNDLTVAAVVVVDVKEVTVERLDKMTMIIIN